jgi:hypothetical protein
VDKHTRILGAILIGYGAGLVIYIGYGIYRIRVNLLEDTLLDRKAEKILMAKIHAGEYSGKTRDDIVADLEFYRIGVREDSTLS